MPSYLYENIVHVPDFHCCSTRNRDFFYICYSNRALARFCSIKDPSTIGTENRLNLANIMWKRTQTITYRLKSILTIKNSGKKYNKLTRMIKNTNFVMHYNDFKFYIKVNLFFIILLYYSL